MVADLPISPSVEHHKKPSLADANAIMEEPKETNGETHTNGVNGEKSDYFDKKDDEKKKKPPPTQFVEPDANSLLDSFGF